MSWFGADFDDVGYTSAPHGTFTGTTNRDYNFDSSYSLLKIKEVQVTYDGVNWVFAKPFDSADIDVNAYDAPATHDPNYDQTLDTNHPMFDERANGFDLYPKFTALQVAAGAAVYVEWWRAPRSWDTSSGTDLYQPCLDLQFQHFPAIGASFEYCKINKPELAATLQGDLYGARTARGQLIRTGLIDEVKDWYLAKNRLPVSLKMNRKVKI